MTPLARTSDVETSVPTHRLRSRIPRQWRLPLVALGGAYLAILGLYWPTTWSLIEKWYTSVSYQHGFAVLPICLYLVWRKRHLLHGLAPTPLTWGPVLLLPPSLAWFAGDLVHVQVVKQMSVILMLQAVTVALLGTTVCRVLMFSLAYLLFAVPVGEDFIPFLQDYTAWFTVQALQWTGIPVYLEGRYLTIPTGTWHVAESCAGIRYIIPSLALGCLFAGLTYRCWRRRLLFLLAAALVPIVANGLRAYLIVILAYLTDNTLAVGVDHFIYGGVFFGVVMFVMFSIGLRWREPQPAPPSCPARHPAPPSASGTSSSEAGWPSPSRLIGVAVTALAIVAVPPIVTRGLAHPEGSPHRIPIVVPRTSPPWSPLPSHTGEWTPQLVGARDALAVSFAHGARRVHLHLAVYRRQRQGAELIHDRNDFIDHDAWRLVAHQKHPVQLDGRAIEVDAWILRSVRTNRLVRLWTWYWVSGEFTTNPYYAKWLQLTSHLWGPPGAAFIGLDTDFDELSPSSADHALQDFLDHLNQPLHGTLLQALDPTRPGKIRGTRAPSTVGTAAPAVPSRKIPAAQASGPR